MAEAQQRQNEPTDKDLIRSLCTLNRSTLEIASGLMGALEAGREHFPIEAVPILDSLSRDFYRVKASNEAILGQVAA